MSRSAAKRTPMAPRAFAMVVALATPGALAAEELPPGGTFFDDDESAAEGYLEAIDAADITRGCNPPLERSVLPTRTLTRGEMASIFVRALDLPAASNPFTDTAESAHVNSISALAGAGVTKGCNPPDNDQFCPDRTVTRGEMAAFMVRALGYPDGADTNYFTDDDGSVFEEGINRLATAGITSGCGDASRHHCDRAPLT